MAKAEYRSSIRSKNLIKKAVVTLIHQKDLNKITVSDVIRESDISRGTFYAHYPDIQSVIEQILAEELSNLSNLINDFYFKPDGETSGDFKLFIKAICEYLSANTEYYNLIANSHLFNDFLERLNNVYAERIMTYLLETDPTKDRKKAEAYMIFIMNGAKNIIKSWLSGEFKATTDEVVDSLTTLISLCRQYYE